jgi:hypothetical protein
MSIHDSASPLVDHVCNGGGEAGTNGAVRNEPAAIEPHGKQNIVDEDEYNFFQYYYL